MTITRRTMKLIATALFAVSAPLTVRADDAGMKTYQAECSACHMAFPTNTLPARSWRAIMSKLDDHFGEDASLSPETAREIEAFLVSRAADRIGPPMILRGLRADQVPLRITDMPWWRGIHDHEVRPSAFKDPRVGTRSNCMACHRDAAHGRFGDD